MKKILYIVSLALAAGLFTGCNEEDFLREDPKTIYTEDNAFEKVSQIDATIVNAYTKFDMLYGYYNFLAGGDPAANFLHGNGSDVLDGTKGDTSASTAFSNYWALRTSAGDFSTLWTSLYQLAADANLAISGMEQMGLDPADAETVYLTAQARFFRGWAYMRLAECFGGVPIVEKFSEELKFDYVRETREATYNFAIEDLKYAAQNLPDYPELSGRLAKGVASHFLCEAYLGQYVETGVEQNLTDALAAADWVISHHPLMTRRFGSRSAGGSQPAGIPDNGVTRVVDENYKLNGSAGNTYFDLFVAGNYEYPGNTESLMIFVQPLYDDVAVYGGHILPLGVTCGPAYRDLTWSEAYVDQNKDADAGGGPWTNNIIEDVFPGQQLGLYLSMGTWGLIGSTDYSDEFVWRDDFAADDRNAQINRYDPVVMDSKSPQYLQVVTKDMLSTPASLSRVSGKITTWDWWGWNKDHMSSFGAPICNQYGRDWYIARSAETYLLRAEVKYRQGDYQGAADDLNAVRARSNATKTYSAADLQTDDCTARTGIFAILDERARELSWEEMRWPTLLRMGGQGKNEVMHQQLENYSMYTFDVGSYKGQDFPEWTLFPIPFSVVQLNSGAVLEQNPGWKD